ncbi:ionotropic receptor 75a-like [Ischnura elegans]|uniref:ionotropic receptor 75a-like n=1 Tax=Ischnura elegans TaxID=197161 RepID=UPI001ED892D3|nr:ionotropic receptor 75a-like [Ischnura elegans]
MNFISIFGVFALVFSLSKADAALIDFFREFCKNDLKFARDIYKSDIYTSVARLDNNAGLARVLEHSDAINHVLNLDCYESWALLDLANDKHLFRPPNRWLLFTSDEELEMNIRGKVGHLNFLLDTDVTIARRVSVDGFSTFILSEVYKTAVHEQLIFKTMGFWKVNYTFPNIYYPTSLRRKNLNGLAIPAVMVVTKNESLNLLDDLRDKYVDTASKYNYHLMNHAMDFINSSAEYTVENTWGNKVNGTYNGMLGQLQSGKSEIGASALFITAKRWPILDYVSMTTPTKLRFIFRQPRLSSIRNIFILPFSAPVWALLYGFLAITAASLFYAVKFENQLEKCEFVKKKRRKPCKYLRASWSDAILLTFGASCQQGFFAEAQGMAGRFVTIVLYGAVILLHTSYAANIVAIIQSSGTLIQTVSDLLSSPMKVGVHDIVYNRHFFQHFSHDPITEQLYQKKIAPVGKKPAFYAMEEGIEKVRTGLFAFHVERGSGYNLIRETFKKEEICNLHEIPFLQPSGAWVAVKRHSPYSKLMKISFRRIQESGLQNRGYLRWFANKPECDGLQSTFVQVGPSDICLSLVALAFGTVSSVLILLCESASFKRKKRQAKLNDSKNKFLKKKDLQLVVYNDLQKAVSQPPPYKKSECSF